MRENVQCMPNPERKRDAGGHGGSFLGRFAPPYSFAPDLRARESLIAVTAFLARIFSTCVWFALWGGLSAWTWMQIPNRIWRAGVAVILVAAFLGMLAALMLGISALERRFAHRR